MATTTELVSVFEERAENLSEEELTEWTVLSEAEKQIIRKLTGPGAKLLSGPRGSGKSTLFKIAYFELMKTQAALPVYVNFSKALALEPLFHSHANATRWFRQWVLAKVIIGLSDSCSKWQLPVATIPVDICNKAAIFIANLEAGNPPDDSLDLTPSSVSKLICDAAEQCGVTRSVLLLDDAAHAFSVKQQREFFEIFRELRSREISAKAAIYPGVTSFSPSFQIGHEAEEIQAWIRPDEENYLSAMRQIAKLRFPDLETKFGANFEETIDVLALASFGLPRGFVNMISEVCDSLDVKITLRKAITEAITTNSDGIVTQFKNVADKLPRFANYVDLGLKLEIKGREAIRAFNKEKTIDKKTVTLALAEPWESELDRILRFMEYAGLLRKVEDISKGVKGSYQRYVLHYSRAIATNALFLGQSYKNSDTIAALKKTSAHALVKTKPETLLGKDYAKSCFLSMPPCPSCGSSRMTEEQKFCMSCGSELRSASVYLELLKAPISKLPIPDRKINALTAAGITTIGQLLSDENHRFRRVGSSIGHIWARKIINIAEEFVSV